MVASIDRRRRDTGLLESSDTRVLEGACADLPEAWAELEHRHGAYARALAAFVPGADAELILAVLVDGMSPARSRFVPVRVAWLSEIAGTSLSLTQDDDEIWAAFLSLSPAWQSALWMGCVDGDGAALIGRALNVDNDSARRAVVVARASLMRRVAQAHTSGSTPDCQRLHQHLRSDQSPSLGAHLTRVLREHGRHCDDCLPLLRDVLRVEHVLRESLAERVLGEYHRQYLGTRPFVRPTRAVSGARTAFELTRRMGRPLIGIGVVAGTAAAVASAFALRVPAGGAGSFDGVAQAAPVISSGQLSQAVEVALVSTTPPPTSSSPTPRQVDAVVAATPTTSESPNDGAGAVETPTDSTSTDTGSAPTTPAGNPGGGQTDPTPGGGTGSVPQAPSEEPKGPPKTPVVQVQVDPVDDVVSVTVDPPVLPEVEVKTPSLPVNVPDLPGSVGGVLNGGVSAGQGLGLRALGVDHRGQ